MASTPKITEPVYNPWLTTRLMTTPLQAVGLHPAGALISMSEPSSTEAIVYGPAATSPPEKEIRWPAAKPSVTKLPGSEPAPAEPAFPEIVMLPVNSGFRPQFPIGML